MTLVAHQPLVSVIIPVRNDAGRLRRCLRSLARNDYPRERVELIVIDNGSHDGSVSVARDAGADVLRSSLERVSELRNLGALSASGEILAFVDADHEVDAGWLRAAVESLHVSRVGAVGALCRAPADGTWVQCMYGALRGQHAGLREVTWLGSGNMAMWRSVFEESGGFDPQLESCEDVDLCRRMRRHGYRLLSDDRLGSIHLGDPATLRELFQAELWRGRDNLRVSFTRGGDWRDWPSALIPVVDLGCVILVAAAVFVPAHGPLLAAAAASIMAGLSGMRALRMTSCHVARRPLAWTQALVVAFAYDAARSASLVTRVGHRRGRHGSSLPETA